MDQFGPIWVTVDSNLREGSFSPHAKVLVQINGVEGDDSGANTFFTFIDPATGKQEAPQSYLEFDEGSKQMVTDNKGDVFTQVVHFKTTIKHKGEGFGIKADTLNQILTTAVHGKPYVKFLLSLH